MSKHTNSQALKKALAKQLGISPDKIVLFDQHGNNHEKITPVFSPTLALLLCAVHNQNVIKICTDVNGEPFATFKPSKVVDDAMRLWYAITEHYNGGAHMPINELIDAYLHHHISEKNNHKIGEFWKIREPFFKMQNQKKVKEAYETLKALEWTIQ